MIVTRNLLVYYLFDFHEVEFWIAVKPEGHLHNEEVIMNSYKHQMSLAIETHFFTDSVHARVYTLWVSP